MPGKTQPTQVPPGFDRAALLVCVKATCLGGRELGYSATLVTDAHSNFSQDAAAMIEKWHAKLAKAGVTLLPTDQVEFS